MNSLLSRFMKEMVILTVLVAGVAVLVGMNLGLLDSPYRPIPASSLTSAPRLGDVEWFVQSLTGFEQRPEILILRPGDVDRQQPHDNDEVYHIVDGVARLTVGEKVEEVGPGMLVHVGAGIPHRFHDVQGKLVALVFPNHRHH